MKKIIYWIRVCPYIIAAILLVLIEALGLFLANWANRAEEKLKKQVNQLNQKR